MINDPAGRPSTTSLFADALAQLTTLFQAEIRLVRTELGEKIADAGRGVGILVVSAVLLVVALFLLLQGVVDLLVYFGLPPFVSCFIVGGVIAVIGVVAVMMALKNLSPSHLTPNRTIHQLEKDATVIKGQVS